MNIQKIQPLRAIRGVISWIRVLLLVTIFVPAAIQEAERDGLEDNYLPDHLQPQPERPPQGYFPALISTLSGLIVDKKHTLSEAGIPWLRDAAFAAYQ